MTSDAAIQLVCFDLGGVLIRICDTWQQAAGLCAVRLPRDPVLGDILPVLREMECGRITPAAFCEQVAPLLGVPSEDVRAMLRAWLRGPYQQTDQLIAQLRERGVATACLSNTNAEHWAMMQTDGPNLLPLAQLTFRFASHELGDMKPATGVFAQVEQATGIAGRHILYFDDNADNCAAATARQWLVTRIDPTGDPARQMAGVLRARRVLD